MAQHHDFKVKNGLVVADSGTFGNTITGTNAVFTGSVTASNILDSADVIGIIASEGLDSNLVISIVDSAYVKLRDRFQDSGLVTSTVNKAYVDALNIDADTLDGQSGTFYLDYNNFTNVPSSSGLDSAGVISLIDSDYIELRRPPETVFNIVNNGTSAYTFTGDGFSSSADNPTLYLTRGKRYKFSVNASGHPLQIRLSSGGTTYNNGVSNNGVQTGTMYFTPDMSAPTSLVYQCTVHSGMVGNIVILDDTDAGLDSANVISLIDSAYIQARQTTGGGLDSASVISLIDSDYVTQRVDFSAASYSALELTAVATGSNTATWTFNTNDQAENFRLIFNGLVYPSTSTGSILVFEATDGYSYSVADNYNVTNTDYAITATRNNNAVTLSWSRGNFFNGAGYPGGFSAAFTAGGGKIDLIRVLSYLRNANDQGGQNDPYLLGEQISSGNYFGTNAPIFGVENAPSAVYTSVNNVITSTVDSAYVNARTDFTGNIDSSYVQLRQSYNYNSLTGRPEKVSTWSNDAGYLTDASLSDYNSVTFVGEYPTKTEYWVVPEGVTSISVVAIGAGGGGGDAASGTDGNGGGGGLAYDTTLSVTPGETLKIIAGTKGYGAYAPSDPPGAIGTGSAGGTTYLYRGSSTVLLQADGGTGAAGGTNGTGGDGGTTKGYDGGGDGAVRGAGQYSTNGAASGGASVYGSSDTNYDYGQGGLGQGGDGQPGALRIIWGANRSYPNTNITQSFFTIYDSDLGSGGGSGIDSAAVISLIDSSYINARIGAGTVEAIVDSAYIQLRDRFQDSAGIISIVDSAYVQARQLKSHAIGGKYRFDTSTTAGDPGSGDIRFSIDWTTGTEGNSYYAYVSETDKDGLGLAPLLDQLTVSTNTNKALVILYKADNPTRNAKFYVTGQTDNGSYRTLDITYVDRDAWGQVSNGDEIFMSLSIIGDKGDIGSGIDSAGVVSLVDSAYINARTSGIDSAAVTSIIDSAYVKLRVDYDGGEKITFGKDQSQSGTLTDTGTQVFIDFNPPTNSQFTSAYNYSSGGIPIGQWLYVYYTFGNTFVTYAQVLSKVDTGSAYTYYTTTINWASGWTNVVNLAENVGARDVGLTIRHDTISDEIQFTAARKIHFTQNDSDGRNFQIEGADVDLVGGNKILFGNRYASASDFPSGSTYTGMFAYAADSDAAYYSNDSGLWVKFGAAGGGGTVDSAYVLSIVDSSVVPFSQTFYHFTADSGQLTFSGFDDDSDTLAYTAGALAVYLNGILLVDSVDYTANDGTSIILQDSSALGDVLTVLKFGGNSEGTGGIDSAAVINLIDSAYIQARTVAGTDSAAIIQLIDSAYIQARQTDVYRDSAFVDLVIEKHLDLGEFILGGDPGVLQYVDFVSQVAGINGAVRPGSGLSKTGGTGWTDAAYFSVDSSFVTDIIDSSYINARIGSGTVEAIVDSAYIQLRDRFQDSAGILAIVDSAYVQARQTNVFNNIHVSGQDSIEANSVNGILTFEAGLGITITTDANTDTVTIAGHAEVDSAFITNIIDSAYIQARQTAGGGGGSGTVDSAQTIALIETTVDSDYIGTKVDFTRGEFVNQKSQYTATASQTVFNHSSIDPTHLDVYLNGVLQVADDDYTASTSAVTFTTGIDSGYSVTIVEKRGRILTQRGLIESKYYFTTPTPTTSITGADDNGITLDYSDGFLDVYLNGILLKDSDDYSTNAGTTVTLVSATDSNDLVTLINRKGVVVSPNVKNYEFTATAGQTTFSGSDINGNTLAYVPGAAQVFLNGILLRNVDYTGITGTSIVLADSASLNDELVVSAFSNPGQNMDLYKFTADSGQTIFSGNDLTGASLAYQPGNVQVFMNGLLLNDSDDYTASNGMSVILTSGAEYADEIKIASFVNNRDNLRTNAWTAPTGTPVTATAGDKLFIDTSSAKTVTLPSSASMGDEIRIIDVTGNAATNNITVSRNGHNIQGAASDLTINVDRAGIGLVYYNSAQGWVLIEN